MQGKVHYGEHVIPYEVRIQPGRAVRKVSIHVEPDGRVVVDAPERRFEEQLRQAINARVRWVHGHVTAAKERCAMYCQGSTSVRKRCSIWGVDIG